MGFGGMEFIVILLMLMGGGPNGGNDLLDMVPTNSYWQAKNVTVSLEQLKRDASPDTKPENVDQLIKDLASDDFKVRNDAKNRLEAMGPAVVPLLKPAVDSKDPEVAAVAGTLVKELSQSGRERAVRRLMAIRSLGERKEKSALALLKGMTEEKELFVADYAARSIAQIEGRPVAAADHQKEVLGDLKILPKETGIVLQGVGMGGAPLSLEKVIDKAADQLNQNGAMMGMGVGGKGADKQKMLARATEYLLKVVDRVGNIRIDGVTIGMAEDIGPQTGWAVVSIRGKYDVAAMRDVFKELAGRGDPRAKASREGTVDIFEMGEDMACMMPSNEQFVVLAGKRGEGTPLDLKKMAAVLNGGAGTFGENEAMAGLIKTVETKSPFWAVARISAEMQKAKIGEAFDTVTMSSKKEKDSLSFTVTGQGSDVEKVKAAVEELTDSIQATIAQGKQMVMQVGVEQSMLDMLESLKVTADGKQATMTGELKTTIVESSLTTFVPFVLMGGHEDEGQMELPAAPENPPAVPADPGPKKRRAPAATRP